MTFLVLGEEAADAGFGEKRVAFAPCLYYTLALGRHVDG